MKKTKKIQRKINKAVRRLNELICGDSLWQGRFVVRQVSRQYYGYPDKSGGLMSVWLKFLDQKTGQSKIIYLDYFSFSFAGNLGYYMNNFIVEYCKVWDGESPYKQPITDYTPDKRWSK